MEEEDTELKSYLESQKQFQVIINLLQFYLDEIATTLLISILDSGALSGLMLDLGLLKISLGGVFFLFLAPAGNPILITFLTLRGKANLYFPNIP